MLKISYCGETENDIVSPLTISHAIVEDPNLDLSDLEEIANHLLAYVTRCRLRIEERNKFIDEYRKERGLEG